MSDQSIRFAGGVCLVVSIAGTLVGCDRQVLAPTSIAPAPIDASAYLNDLIGLMQKYSINRDRIDWDRLREGCLRLGEVRRRSSTCFLRSPLPWVG